MMVIAQHFSPQSLRITIQMPIGKWNRFKEALRSLFNLYCGRLVGADGMASHEPRPPSPTILPSETAERIHGVNALYKKCTRQRGIRIAATIYSLQSLKKHSHNEGRGPDMRLDSLFSVQSCRLPSSNGYLSRQLLA